MIKKLLSVALFLCGIKAQAQNALSFNYIDGLKVFSTYTSPLLGTYSGGEIGYQFNNNQVIRVSYINLNDVSVDKHKVFGNNFNATFGYNFKLFKFGTATFKFNPNLGFAYYNKTFYNTENLNMINGGHLNILAEGRLFFDLPLTRNGLSLNFGTSLSHASDSRAILPNDGMNYWKLYTGLSQSLGSSSYKTGTFQLDNVNIFDFEFLAGYTSGVKTGYFKLFNGKGVYPDTAIQGKSSKIYKQAFSFSFMNTLNDANTISVKQSLDVIHSNTTIDENRFFATYQGEYTPSRTLLVGTTVGLDFTLKHLVVSGNIGWILSDLYTSKSDFPFYSSFSAKYFITHYLAIEAKSYSGNFASIGVDIRGFKIRD